MSEKIFTMIEEITLQFGSAKGQLPISISRPAVTVFVGPNNSGKSQILREINAACQQGARGGWQILGQFKFEPANDETVRRDLGVFSSPPRLGESGSDESRYLEINGKRFAIHLSLYTEARKNPNGQRSNFYAQYYSSHYTLNLDGASRIGLVNSRAKGDLKYPDNSFSRMFTDDARRASFRRTVYDAVGLYPGFDMSHGADLQLRFGSTQPPRERTTEDDILEWMRKAGPIDQVSDGVKAFTGMLLELRAGDPKIVLIDEPEAFLHPALAFKLGREVAKTANESGKHVFIATHSAQFLMGAIQSGARVDIVRLTYKGGMATARLLPNDDLSRMMRDPLLRSTNALAGLFYENVVVTEADADRSFYQEINERLLEHTTGRGMPNALFLNANGKDTVYRIVGPLRRLGIPTAAVLDIDILNRSGQNWTNHLTACAVPDTQHQPLSTQRATAWDKLVATEKNPKTEGGLDLLLASDKEAAENLLDFLDDYGFFVLRHGEVEQWLKSVKDMSRSKHTWLHNVFEAMGSDPTDSSYVRPTDDDVWAFIDRIGAWMKNPSRRGIPIVEEKASS